MTDGTVHPGAVQGVEFKFQFPPNPGDDFTGRLFNGFRDVDGGPTPARSEAITSGRGLSEGIPGAIFGTNALARWTVTATGKLGGGSGASWSSRASGVDPIALTADAFEGIVEPFYDLFFEVGLTDAAVSPRGSIELLTSYETSLGTESVLSIVLGPEGASVRDGTLDGLEIYLLEDFSEGPTENLTDLTDLVALESLLGDDFVPDLVLDQPIYLGLLLQGLPRPTTEFADGSLARVHVGLSVSDAAVREVPAPGSLSLLVGGLIFLGESVRRLRFSARCVRQRPLHPRPVL